MHQYMDRLLQLSVSDPNIYRSFLEVMHMTKRPASLFAPNLLLRVLKNIGTNSN